MTYKKILVILIFPEEPYLIPNYIKFKCINQLKHEFYENHAFIFKFLDLEYSFNNKQKH